MIIRCLLVSVIFVSSWSFADWAQFRGPGTAGHATSAPFPDSFTADDLAWQVDLPGIGSSSPIVWDDHIYLTSSTDKIRSLICLSSENGSTIWKKDFPVTPFQMHKFNNLASSTPCANKNGVYISWTNGKTREALGFDHSGKQLWSVDLGAYYVNHGSGGSPIVVDDLVIIINDVELEEEGTRFVVGLNTKDGSEAWRLDFDMGGKAGFHTPTLHHPEGGPQQVIISCNPHGILSIDPTTGKKLWETGPQFSTRTVACPLVLNNQLFVTAGSGGAGKESAMIQVAKKDGDWTVAVNTSLRKALPYVPSPIAHEGIIYMLGDRGIMTAIRYDGKTEVYQERVDGNYYASPICVGDKIYCVSREGELVTLQAGETFKILGRSQLGDRADATPAVHQNRMYIRTNSKLLCLPAK